LKNRAYGIGGSMAQRRGSVNLPAPRFN